jgi:hypothetical protein
MTTYKIIGGDQKVYGPVSEEELRRWVTEGRLNGQSQVQPEGAAAWQPLSSLPEFAEALQAKAGPPPGPSAPAPPINAEALAAEILARPPEVQIGRCLSRSWNLLTANFGLLYGATFVVWLVGAVCERIPFVGLAYLLIRGALYGGLYLIFLKRLRGQNAEFGDVFAGFRLAFVQLLLTGLVSSLLSGLGACFCLLPWLYLSVAWVFSVPLVIDKRLEFWSAMELSRKIVTRVWFQIFALAVLVFLPVILVSIFSGIKVGLAIASMLQDLMSGGSPDPQRITQFVTQLAGATLPLWLLTKAVLLVNMPFAVGALMSAYEDLFGPRPAPRA